MAQRMPVYTKGNYMLAGRVSYGVLNEDNYTLGFSGGYGRTRMSPHRIGEAHTDPAACGLFLLPRLLL